MKNKYYITTTLPYVNAEPHIGFGLEIVAADVLARYQRTLNNEVVFNTGTDEHGLKIYEKAKENNVDPQDYVNMYAAKFNDLKLLFNLSYTHFIRTTDERHKKAAQDFWNICNENGDIYKKNYSVRYCVGCELEKTDSDLVDGKCSLHPTRDLELIEEENYFFRFSNYQKPLLDLYKNNPDFVKPEGKYKEIVSFVEKGLKDFSISRLKSKLPWGVPVPGDDEQVMYVWFDALVNYISTLGWPNTDTGFSDFWPGVQIAGKDNLRQQSAMWQAMLLSAKLPTSKQILINGFISIDGNKMSKSLGNVISPKELVEKYTIDGARFLLLDMGPVHEDVDITWDQLNARYNSFLANGLGNAVARTAAMAAKSEFSFGEKSPLPIRKEVIDQLHAYRFDKALEEVWKLLSLVDKTIEKERPWELSGEKLKTVLSGLIDQILQVGYDLQPFLPESAEKIIVQFSSSKIEKSPGMFPRIM